MKRLFTSLLILGLLMAWPVPAEGESEGASDATVLSGEYHWSARDMTGPVEATFTPTGKGTWSVDFNFTFRDKPRTYSGTAEGSLTSGDLKGEVKNEDKKRTFTFDGAIKDGTFQGTHQEIREDGTRDTGTITLKLNA